MQTFVEERKKLMEELGNDHPNLPVRADYTIHHYPLTADQNDAFTWLLARAEGEERTVDNLATRMMLFNFAALHTTSITFTQALSKLVAEGEKYMQPMREEAESAVRQKGWTRATLDKMPKIDS
jgi:hypothetical protein